MRRSLFPLLAMVILAATACGGDSKPQPAATPTSALEPTATPPPGASATPTVERPPGLAMPDPALTPGDVFPVGAAEICVRGYAGRVRDVHDSVKNQVYAEYHIASHKPGEYEVDHLISLELGGSNDIKNLWPQPAEPRPGFHEKDRLEDALHDLVCAGKLDLTVAQHDIATDWYAAYLRYVVGQGN